METEASPGDVGRVTIIDTSDVDRLRVRVESGYVAIDREYRLGPDDPTWHIDFDAGIAVRAGHVPALIDAMQAAIRADSDRELLRQIRKHTGGWVRWAVRRREPAPGVSERSEAKGT